MKIELGKGHSLQMPSFDLDGRIIMECCIGLHASSDDCTGIVDLKSSDENNNVLCCRKCGFAVSVPKTITTFGQLQNHFLRP